MRDEPLLSVVIPTRNRQGMAAQAIASALLPLPFPAEVLVSDNASTDDTPALARDFSAIRFVRRPTLLPMAEHWNLCVSEARGKYVKLLCDDDWLLPGALAREVAALEAQPSASLAASAWREVANDGGIVAQRGHARAAAALNGEALFWRMLLKENIVGPPSSVTFRKSAFRGFPPYSYAADWAAWVLLAEAGGFVFLAEPGAHFRLHTGNLTHARVEDSTDFLEVQALRRECLARLHGLASIAGALCFAWIYSYRFARRLARLTLRRRITEIPAFCAKALTYQRPALRSR